MDIAHILEELAYDMGELPREAIETAILKRQQITPYLLDVVQDAIDRIDDVVEDDNYQGHLFAIYLLAQFREPKAFSLILKLFSFPGDISHMIAGDILTEDLSRILASLCQRNITPIKALIENPSINEYVRAAAQSCLVTLVGCGILSRHEVISYFLTLFQGKLERVRSFAWDNLVLCACDLYPEELYTDIVAAYKDNLVDTFFISADDVSTTLTKRKETFLFRLFQNAELIEDTVTEMEKWLSSCERELSYGM